jgi:tetrahydromethanopterin S-methyltransferase subunit F
MKANRKQCMGNIVEIITINVLRYHITLFTTNQTLLFGVNGVKMLSYLNAKHLTYKQPES